MFIGEGRIMKRKNYKYRPCIGRSVSFSIMSFMLFFISIVGILPNVEKKIIALVLVVFFFLLNIIFVLYSILKLNSYVYLDNDKIFQKQYGKMIEINYDNITDVKLSFAWYIRSSYAIKIYDKNKKIMFEITSKVFEKFISLCSNTEVKNKIDKLLKEKNIYYD